MGRQGGLVWCAWRGAREGWCVVSAHVLVSMPHVGKWGYRHAVHMHSTRTTYCRCFACRGPWSACLRAWACTTCGGVHMAGGTRWAYVWGPCQRPQWCRRARRCSHTYVETMILHAVMCGWLWRMAELATRGCCCRCNVCARGMCGGGWWWPHAAGGARSGDAPVLSHAAA